MSRAHESGDSTHPSANGGAGSTAAGGRRGEDLGGSSILRSLLVFGREIVIVVALAVVLSLIAKTWLVQTFWIPSASMMNTLVRDDRVLVSKLTPSPFALHRGDVVVFADPGGWLDPTVQTPPREGLGESINSALTWVGLLPEDEGNHLIKRVIGMPGDRVACCSEDGRLTVNGTAIDEPYLHPGDTPSDIEFDATVPADRVWVMGDHRSDSRDSRYQEGDADPGSVGSVPIDHIVGRAFAVVWPLNRLAWLGQQQETFAGVPAPSAPPSPVSSTPSGGSPTSAGSP